MEKTSLYSSREFERFLLVRRYVREVRPITQGVGSKIAIVVAAVTGTLMQQRHLVIVLTNSDGLECFPTSHKETQTTFAKLHNLAYRYVTFLNLSAPFVILTGVSQRIS